MDIFSQNLGIMNQAQLNIIKQQKVAVIGLGGLGGYIANSLARLGVEKLVLIDFDCFQITNLNRQLFSNLENINMPKVEVIKHELQRTIPNLKIDTYKERVEHLSDEIFLDIQIIFDAVDQIESKKHIEGIASKMNIPLIHGAIAGYYGQLGIAMPNSNLIYLLYEQASQGIEKQLKSPTFIPPIIANMMVLEFIKFHINPEQALINQILMIDTLNHDYQIVFKK